MELKMWVLKNHWQSPSDGLFYKINQIILKYLPFHLSLLLSVLTASSSFSLIINRSIISSLSFCNLIRVTNSSRLVCAISVITFISFCIFSTFLFNSTSFLPLDCTIFLINRSRVSSFNNGVSSSHRNFLTLGKSLSLLAPLTTLSESASVLISLDISSSSTTLRFTFSDFKCFSSSLSLTSPFT
ncbi:hypothetical protein AGLY_001012 [Aphis glycines]|uniref:Uncharacterized protein n=1 Tax=Aphis glycines TaxID=307491 RepID=A0A6G0UA39_APHGL|nr:hypothetical protein AGLY_001012 [Aphis glycines]